jgi:hypothetical protein
MERSAIIHWIAGWRGGPQSWPGSFGGGGGDPRAGLEALEKGKIFCCCTQPSTDPPSSQGLLGGGGNGDDGEDTSNQSYRRQALSLWSNHLMFTKAHTLTSCSLAWYIWKSRMDIFLSFFTHVAKIPSQSGIAWLQGWTWLAKMHRTTK